MAHLHNLKVMLNNLNSSLGLHDGRLKKILSYCDSCVHNVMCLLWSV